MQHIGVAIDTTPGASESGHIDHFGIQADTRYGEYEKVDLSGL